MPRLGPTPTTLVLVRHAETVDNVQIRLSGWTDSALSPRGLQQIPLVADHIRQAHPDLAALYASPLIRARKTAEAIGALTGHTPVLHDDLREMYFGELDGRPYEELKDLYAHLLQSNEDDEQEDFMWPNGESRSGFVARIMGAVQHISEAHPGKTACVVTHGGVIATVLTLIQGESVARWRRWVIPNASLSEILYDPTTGTGALLRHADDAHLAALTAEETGGQDRERRSYSRG